MTWRLKAPVLAMSVAGAWIAWPAQALAADDAITFGAAGLFVAAVAGLLSFLSPCVLPLVPGYVALLSGVSGSAPERMRGRTLAHGAAFVAGFSIVFVALGASATVLGGAIRDYDDGLRWAGGLVLIVFGLVVAGIIRLPALQRDARLLERATHLRRFGLAGSGVVGAAFAAGWTPCIGPILGGILTIAATTGSSREGVALLLSYSLGLGIPFLVAAVAIDRWNPTTGRLRTWTPWVNRVSGILLVILGILLITGVLTTLSARLASIGSLFADFSA